MTWSLKTSFSFFKKNILIIVLILPKSQSNFKGTKNNNKYPYPWGVLWALDCCCGKKKRLSINKIPFRNIFMFVKSCQLYWNPLKFQWKRLWNKVIFIITITSKEKYFNFNDNDVLVIFQYNTGYCKPIHNIIKCNPGEFKEEDTLL